MELVVTELPLCVRRGVAVFGIGYVDCSVFFERSILSDPSLLFSPLPPQLLVRPTTVLSLWSVCTGALVLTKPP